MLRISIQYRVAQIPVDEEEVPRCEVGLTNTKVRQTRNVRTPFMPFVESQSFVRGKSRDQRMPPGMATSLVFSSWSDRWPIANGGW